MTDDLIAVAKLLGLLALLGLLVIFAGYLIDITKRTITGGTA